MWPSSVVVRLSAKSARRLPLAEERPNPEIGSMSSLIVLSSQREVGYEGDSVMATWTTESEARVEVDEELKGAFLAALVAAFAEPKPALVFGSGRLLARLEV